MNLNLLLVIIFLSLNEYQLSRHYITGHKIYGNDFRVRLSLLCLFVLVFLMLCFVSPFLLFLILDPNKVIESYTVGQSDLKCIRSGIIYLVQHTYLWPVKASISCLCLRYQELKIASWQLHLRMICKGV